MHMILQEVWDIHKSTVTCNTCSSCDTVDDDYCVIVMLG